MGACPVWRDAKGLAEALEGVAAVAAAGEVSPNLEGCEALLTDANTLLGGDRNPGLPGLPSLNATGEGLASILGLRQLSDMSLDSTPAVGVGR